ncbi:MAG TPA: DUF4982 domain-containing protein [Candidatus Merdenecus merdavium]|nr:DUF4982 domain-containing protein [Candidatus Merdenecus merdavium]
MIRQNFNDNWSVVKDTGNMATAAFMGNVEEKTVHLPYDAMIYEERKPDTPNGAQTGFYPGGRYIYQKRFLVEEKLRGKELYLEFEGIYQKAELYLNGAFLKRNLHGYSNFYVRLNDWIKYGTENVIKVIADNTNMPNSRWYTGSGIYRNVKLITGDQIHMELDGMKVRTVTADQRSAVVEVKSLFRSVSPAKEKVDIIVKILKDERCICEERQKLVILSGTEETVVSCFCIEYPEMWSCESPELYKCEVIVEKEGQIIDKTEETFGIRTLTIDAKHGVRINGKPVKLRGTCLHHDNGILGAATFEKAEERRCRQLSEAGFNSIRSAHQPLSKAMLDACDRMGMLVMDELSDMWTIHKNQGDFASDFAQCWEEIIDSMVAKDYNHPSVILYSVGNEIQEVGNDAGAVWNRRLCNRFRTLDSTRYTTNGLNGLMAAGHRMHQIMSDVSLSLASERSDENREGSGEGSNAMNSFMSFMEGEKGDIFAVHPLMTEALEGCSASCDVIGLNYLTARHELEKELHPHKPVVGTETFPADIVRLWRIVEENDHVLGDFTWTGYDYLGEAGCGIFHYDNKENFSSIYPERVAYIGDIDLVGYRRPLSYLREIVYGLRKTPYIAVERLNRHGQVSSKTPWMYKDVIASWTWPGYEGVSSLVEIYSDADEVELLLNGKSVGRKPVGKTHGFTAVYEVPYAAGNLEAINYRNGESAERKSLITATDVTQIHVDLDQKELEATGEDLAFLKIWLADRDGRENLWEKKKIRVGVEGKGKLEALGSANPSSLDRYDEAECETFDGYAMAVVRSGMEEGIIKVTIEAEKCESKSLEISVTKD